MPFDPMYLVYGGIFLCVLLFIEGAFFLISDLRGRDRNPNRRLRMLASGRKREDVLVTLRRDKKTRAQQDKEGLLARFSALVTQSGLTISAGRFAVIMLVMAIAGFVGPSLTKFGPVFGVGGAILFGLILPIVFLLLARKKRMAKFGRQLPDAIEVAVRSLRAGHPLPSAIALVAREMPDPIGTEFGIAVDEITYGLDLETSLRNMAVRVGHPDVRFLVVAVNIQSKVGGNLAEILGNLSHLIRERFRMYDKIKALSAEGRFSALFLSVLPFVLILVINIMSPDFYGAVIEEPMFLIGMGFAAFLMISGDFVMYRLVNFRV